MSNSLTSSSLPLSLSTMSLHSSSDQDFCSILVLTDEDTADKQCEAHLSLSTYVEVQESQMCLDAHLNCKNVVDSGKDGATKYSPCMVYVDVEKGNSGSCKINEETGGRLKAEMALTKALRRQNSLQTSSTPVAPLMNQILMLLNFDDKDKATVEKPHDTPTNKWRKYKRAASFDSRQIVLLFSVLSSMGTIVLIYLTLRYRQIGDGGVHM